MDSIGNYGAVGAFGHHDRALLECLALLAPPYSFTLLTALAGEDAIRSLEALVPRHLRQIDGGFYFATEALREAHVPADGTRVVREARVLRALMAMHAPTLQDARASVDIALRLGEREAILGAAIRAAEIAIRQAAYAEAAAFYEIAHQRDAVAFLEHLSYVQSYANVLRLLERDVEAKMVLLRALATIAPGVPGFGGVVRSLANVVYTIDGLDAALAICAQYDRKLPDGEAEEVRSAALSLRVHAGDLCVIDTNDFLELTESGSDDNRRRLLHTKAMACAVLGRSSDAAVALATAELLGGGRHLVAEYAAYARLACLWHDRGPSFVIAPLRSLYETQRDSATFLRWKLGLAEFCAGEIDRAHQRVKEGLGAPVLLEERDRLLSLAAALLCYGVEDEPLQRAVRDRAAEILELRETGMAMEIAVWQAASPSGEPSADAIAKMLAWANSSHSHVELSPWETAIGLIERRHDTRGSLAPDRNSRWLRLARQTRELSRGVGARRLRDVREHARALGAHGLIPLIERLTVEPASVQERLTSREAEVGRLVALGHTNRSIAEQLSVSEHTVASHIAKIFGKLGVRTRTELAHRLDRA